jgi:hypothetical protein
MHTSPVALITFVEISRNIVVVPEGVAGLIRLTWSWNFIYIEFFCRAIRRCLRRISLYFLLFGLFDWQIIVLLLYFY